MPGCSTALAQVSSSPCKARAAPTPLMHTRASRKGAAKGSLPSLLSSSLSDEQPGCKLLLGLSRRTLAPGVGSGQALLVFVLLLRLGLGSVSRSVCGGGREPAGLCRKGQAFPERKH